MPAPTSDGEGNRRGPDATTGKPRPGGGQGGAPKPKVKGGLRLQRLDGRDHILDHPKCVIEMELDYIEGMELRREGDPEGAQDALRYALQGCGDNMWVHNALGWIALEDFNDPTLARGHFGYGFELAWKAIPAHFDGRIPQEHPANEPLYDSIDGLIRCYEKLDRPDAANELRAQARTWLGR